MTLPEPVTGESLAARALAIGARHKPEHCDVCGLECSWTDPDTGITRHASCDPKETST